jgi:hypothetical protein
MLNLSPDQLKAIIDGVFAAVEAHQQGHPFVVAALKAVNGVIDAAGLPALLDALKARGVVS